MQKFVKTLNLSWDALQEEICTITSDFRKVSESLFFAKSGKKVLVQVYQKFYYRLLSTDLLTLMLIETDDSITLKAIGAPTYQGLLKICQRKESCIKEEFTKRFEKNEILLKSAV